jgi:hypothetical protein
MHSAVYGIAKCWRTVESLWAYMGIFCWILHGNNSVIDVCKFQNPVLETIIVLGKQHSLVDHVRQRLYNCVCVWKCSSESVRAVCDLTSPGRKVKLSGHFIAEPRSLFTTFISFIVYLSLSLFDGGCGGKANHRMFCCSLRYFTSPYQLKLLCTYLEK